MSFVKLLGPPPRPLNAAGEVSDGEVVVNADGIELVFVWEAARLVDVRSYTGAQLSAKYVKLRMQDSDESVNTSIMEWCGVQDADSGSYVFWQVRADTGCPY